MLPDPRPPRGAASVALPHELRGHRGRGLDDARARSPAARAGCRRAGPQLHVGAMLRALVATPLRLREATSRFLAYGRAVEAMRAAAVPEPHWYLAGHRRRPGRQRKRHRLRAHAARPRGLRARRLPCALLTNTEENLSFYERHGFEVVLEDGRPDDGPHAWMMRRRPSPLGSVAWTMLPKRFPEPRRDRRRPRRGRAARARRGGARTSAGSPAASSRAATWGSCVPRPRRPLRPDPAPLPGRPDRRGRRPPRRHRRRDRPPDEVAPRRAVARRRLARAAREDPLAAPRHVPRAHRRRAALPPPLPRPADERGDARRLHAARAHGHGDPPRARRRGLRRGRDAGPPAALRRRVRAAVRRRTTTSSTRRSTCGSRPSCTSSA